MSEYPFSVVPLGQQDRGNFTCGIDALNAYLLTQAGQDMKRRVAVCFLAVDNATGAIAGYYTLSACHVQLADVSLDWQKSCPAILSFPQPASAASQSTYDTRARNWGLPS